MRILVAGELNPDLLLRGYRTFPAAGKEILVDDLALALGSSSAICAAGLARLGNQVRFASKVGCDPWGDFSIAALAARGVEVSFVERDPQVTTGLTVSISSARDRALVTYPGAIRLLHIGDIPEAAFAGCRHLHVSSYFLQDGLRTDCRALFAAARARGLTTSLDPGYDPRETWDRALLDVLEETDVFLPNEVELEAMTGQSEPEAGLRALAARRARTIVKLGARGCLALDGDRVLRVPSLEMTPVDTTGAGDSFNAGFLHGWLRQWPLEKTLRFATACGALSTRGAGGTEFQPTEEEAGVYV